MLILRAKGRVDGRVTNPRRVVERPTAVAATSTNEDEEGEGSMVVMMVTKPNNPKRRSNRVEGVVGAFLGIRGL